MKQVLIKKGVAFTADVSPPQIDSRELLIQVQASCLSTGTELSGLRSSGIPLWKKAFNQPEKVISAIKMIDEIGFQRTLSLVNEKKELEHVTGYSAAGIVVNVGKEVSDVSIGDRVACAGAQYAHHAELIRVPRNLCAHIPTGLDFGSASTVTLGAIALQGIRRAQPTLGETFVVLGLGILGQLTSQMLRANGCRVIGIDIESFRVNLGLSLGMEYGITSADVDTNSIARITNGHGVDGVIITAATASDFLVSQAFRMCRKKGRVVLVGDVGLNLNRSDFYFKEIDFLISASYGPGRYDKNYEEQGLDYPIGYVRWTENRNMQAYLQLLSEDRIKLSKLIQAKFPIEQASEAYKTISENPNVLVALLTYPNNDTKFHHNNYSVEIKSQAKSTSKKITVALIGAGNFAKSTHLPNIKLLNKTYHLRAIVGRNGPTAKNIGQQFNAEYVTTDPQDVFNDPEIDAVLITTRHHLHTPLALLAMKAGKHVLLEKPMALTRDELKKLNNFFHESSSNDIKKFPILFTGYNRRFSNYTKKIKEILDRRDAPFIINYRMNAGFIPQDHWVHGIEGGGRNIGEACHIYDLFTYLVNDKVESVSAHAIKPQARGGRSVGFYGRNDNFIATFSFMDGSIANLIYTGMGHKDIQKETAEIYVDGKIILLNDYRSLIIYGDDSESLQSKYQDKGHKLELEEFALGIKTGEWPIPLWQQLQVSEMAFNVEEIITT